MNEETIETCSDCGDFFNLEELTKIDNKLYCVDCSARCLECNEMINEDFCFNKYFCSKECKDQYFYDLYEDDYKQ